MSVELDFTKPAVMGILNVTSDSFFAGSRNPSSEQVRQRVARILAEGADMVDIGGYSSRPGAEVVPEEEELRRVMEGVAAVREANAEIPVSIDTFRSAVARGVLEEWGPCIINDISAGEADERMIDVAAEFDAPYVAMHMRGTPETMASLTSYDDVVGEVRDYLGERAELLKRRGVNKIILDPGFGFAKNTEQNYRLLANLRVIRSLGYPLLAGLSRKGMIYRTLGITPQEALPGTTALNWECMRQGADIIRVHDVAEACQIRDIFGYYSRYGTEK